MISFKHTRDRKMFSFLHPVLIMIIADTDYYLSLRGHDGVKITDSWSTKSRDEKIGRVSSSHSEGRAVDFSVFGISKDTIKNLQTYLEKKYLKYGAISRSTGEVNLFVYGDDRHLDHVHLQIHKRFAVTPHESIAAYNTTD